MSGLENPEEFARRVFESDPASFRVPHGLAMAGNFYSAARPFWRFMGRLETHMLAEHLPVIQKPVYICGLPRSGSTILLDILARHPHTASFAYKDFPFVHIPFLWNRYMNMFQKKAGETKERAHKDRLEVSPDSPEALEEMLWMDFFPHLHDPARCNLLDEKTKNPDFERYYKNTIRKLLLARGRSRYLAKGNYNAGRIPYLLKLFPDAAIIVPVRHPAGHIASLVKQHALFRRVHKAERASLAYMSRSGHFEFGTARRPVHYGHPDKTKRIMACWREGQEIEGWALYWNDTYRTLFEQVREKGLEKQVRFVRYEDLCGAPEETLAALLHFAGLNAGTDFLSAQAARLRAPDYYKTGFSAEIMALIAEITGETAALYEYGPESFSA